MADVAIPTFKKRANKAGNVRKRPATPPPETSDQSESDYTDDEDGARVKRRRKDGVKVGATIKQSMQDLSKSAKYSADRSATISANDFATKTSNLYAGEASASQREREHDDIAKIEEPEARDGTYKGTASYGSFIQKSADAPVRKLGPMKAPTNVRTITTTDFAPDVCKDYKLTGFCGFGDGCKFLHAREDYAQGWQLDRDWEKAGKSSGNSTTAKSAAVSDPRDGDDEAKLLESIPFACIICKQDYTRPVVTRCGHYFCEKCAMQRYMREKKRTCANCGADTNGTFNVARKLKELLEKKKRRAEERAQAEEEAGKEEASTDA